MNTRIKCNKIKYKKKNIFSDPIEEIPENGNVVHQDDDGFESLNGNVSSDNEKETAEPAIEKKVEILEAKTNVVEITEQEFSVSRHFSGMEETESFIIC